MAHDSNASGDVVSELEDSASPRADDAKILSEARARFSLAEEAEAENRRLALEDLKFRAGEQWDEKIRVDRDLDGRPCLTINKIPQFIQQVTNDQRQNRPSIKVHPVDDQGDPETAEVMQGLIRHIEYNSNADVAYDTAFDGAVTGGFGYFRFLTAYASPTSFEQEILIKRIRNHFSVMLDPYSKEPDGSDANWGFIFDDISRDEYRVQFPDSKAASQEGWDLLGDQAPGWKSANGCRVAEYFYKEWRQDTLVLLSNLETALKSELPEILPQGVTVIQERPTQVPVIRWCKINGLEILEKTDWLGKYIPIVPVYGQELDVNGERVLEGVVRNAKDPARMYNYWASAETEAIALAPRAPFIAAEGQLEGYEQEWATANRRNHSVLTYKATNVAGTLIGPPQRNAFEPAVQAITQARMLASDDLKATTGIYDASLGGRSNETSGVAIQKRNIQAQTSNFHFIDNLTRSLRHAGRIAIDLIPKVYDTARAARIIGEDGEQKIVKLNQPTGEMGKNGKELIYQLDSGKYDVTVTTGPSYASKRQEAVSSMLEVTRAVPQLMQVAGDLMVKNMDWPGAQEIADRLKKALPPGLAEDPNEKKQPIPPQVQAQMQQMGGLIEQLTAKLNEAQDQIQQKRIELESKERIEMAKLDTQTTIELARLDAKDSIVLLQSQLAQIESRMRLLGAGQPIPDVTQDQPQDQSFEPPTDGAMGAQVDMGGEMPPGGPMPEQSMEPV